MRKTKMRLTEMFCIKGDIQSIFLSMIIALTLCIPIVSHEYKPEDVVQVASTQVVETYEVRDYNMASRSMNVVDMERIKNEEETKPLISYYEYVEVGEEITEPLIRNEFVLPADPIPEPEPEPVVVEEPEVEVITSINKDITKPSGLTAEQYEAVIDKMLAKYKKKNSKLDGAGAAIYRAEQEYGVNGIFLLGIISNESGWGTKLANTNNLGGITKKGGGFRAFNSVDECIMYMGRLLSNNYIHQGRTTVQAVGNKYCPDTAANPGQNVKWANTVNNIMNRYHSTAENMLGI